MDAGLLFSGGTDSTLAALILDRFYDVTLVTAHFGVTDQWETAAEPAAAIDLPFEQLELDSAVADEVVEYALTQERPRRAIDVTHGAALEALAAAEYDIVADGTRRDDRVPSVSRAKATQLERQYDVDYVAPLSGFGRDAVDRLVNELLEVEVGPPDEIDRPDYAAELRALCASRDGEAAAEIAFPVRDQTAVVGIR